MSPVAVPPCPAVLLAADYLEKTCERFVATRADAPHKYHPILDTAITHFAYVAIRNAEGIVALARTDLVLYPAASTLARSVFEIAVRVVWLTQPIVLQDRLSRYLGLLAEQISAQERLLARASHIPEALPDIQDELASLREWRDQLVNECAAPRSSVPHFEALLNAINRPDLYGLYIVLSQFSHGGHAAADIFSRERADGSVGDVVRLRDWFYPLAFSAFALEDACRHTIRLFGGSQSHFLPKDFRDAARAAYAALDSSTPITSGV